MKAMQSMGWMVLHFSPCAALRSCGRIDEHWCRAHDRRCDFPQVDSRVRSWEIWCAACWSSNHALSTLQLWSNHECVLVAQGIFVHSAGALLLVLLI